MIVVFEHLSGFLPTGYWEVGSGFIGDVLSTIINAPFHSGTFAVSVFFVISGYVIAAAAQSAVHWPLLLVWVSRYLRLTLPMVFALVIAAFLFTLFPNEMPKIYAFHPNNWTSYATPPPTIIAAITNALWGEYLFGQHDFVSVIWSMRVELLGSLGVYSFYHFVKVRHRVLFLVLLSIILPVTDAAIYATFPGGALLFELNSRAKLSSNLEAGFIFIASGLCFSIIGKFHRPTFFFSLGGISIVLGIIMAPRIQTLLQTRITTFFGKISYSLYLIHLPFLYTIFAVFYIHLGRPPILSLLMVWVIIFFCFIISVSYVIMRWIDAPITQAVRPSMIRKFWYNYLVRRSK